MCPQKAGGLEFDLKLVGDVRLEHDTGGESELECLNLVVTVQQIGGFDRGSGLPVMVWYVCTKEETMIWEKITRMRKS